MSLPQRCVAGMRTFTMERPVDHTGVSGEGTVLEGAVFASGDTVIHWLTPAPSGNIVIWRDFHDFMETHVTSHPQNATKIVWDDGEIWDEGSYNANSNPFRPTGKPRSVEG